MQIDVQPTRLGRLHAVMEMSTLDATIDGTRVSGSFTQLVYPYCMYFNVHGSQAATHAELRHLPSFAGDLLLVRSLQKYCCLAAVLLHV